VRHTFSRPSSRPLYRWQLGLLLLGLPRRLIPRGFRDLPPGRANEPVSYPVGQARPGQLGCLPDQLLVLGVTRMYRLDEWRPLKAGVPPTKD
jgi:hypothetical protein